MLPRDALAVGALLRYMGRAVTGMGGGGTGARAFCTLGNMMVGA